MKQLQISDLGSRQTARDNAKLGDQIIKIELKKIIVRSGFNVRTDYGDLEALASSIKENGQEVPGRVDVLKNGTFLLTDGHRRFEAMKLLGDEFLFKAIVNSRETTEEDRIVQMFTTQDNKNLTPSESAELIQRLLTFGKNQKEVAKRIGRSPAYVSQMISFARQDESVKEEVKSGKTTVSKILKEHKKKPLENEQVNINDPEQGDKFERVASIIIEKLSLKSHCQVMLIEILKENF